MFCLSAIAAVLLGSALATPHNKHIDPHRFHHGKKHHPIFANTTTIPIGTGSGFIRPTGVLSLTSLFTSYAQVTDGTGSAALISTGLPDVPQSSAQFEQAFSTSKSEGCAGGTVTITVPASSTETVTVSSSVTSEASSTSVMTIADTKQSSSSAEPLVSSAVSPLIIANSSPVSLASHTTLAAPAPSTSSQASSETVDLPTSATSIKVSSVAPRISAPSPPASASSVLAASTISTAVANAPPPQPGLPFKTKRGIIASGNSQNQLTAAIGVGKISWLGNWYSAPPPTIPATVQFVPQNYNKDSDADGTFTRNAKAQIAKGAKYLLSYGEPAAAKLSVTEVVQMFKQSMQPFTKQGITVSSPTTLQTDGDFEWLESFLQACEGCDIGFLAIHYMNKYHNGAATELKTTLTRAHDLATKYNVPGDGAVWLDNFEVVGSVQEQMGFLRDVVPWLEEQDWVKAYAYVPDEVGQAGSGANFIDAGGALNELGRFYVEL